MLNLSGEIRVFVCTQPADMRRSFDGLCGMVESIVQRRRRYQRSGKSR